MGTRTAQVLIAELGGDMGRFPSSRHAAAWAGMCPGTNASGGTRRRATTRQGSPWLRGAVAEAAWAAGRCTSGDLPEQARRLTARRGRKRAILAVGHSLLVSAYQLLQRGTSFTDLGPELFDRRAADRVTRRSVTRLEARGYAVTRTASKQVA